MRQLLFNGSLTDGMMLPKGIVPSEINCWGYLSFLIIQKGIDSYIEDLLHFEKADPECSTYPRLKKSDDKAGLVISF
ncbi:hypothetical protein [Virgibacillus sp. Bac332]|uniref:hypothetical protein n=1 Tax=Virgibacillus sp. Bac332 TaxID=2419842 RepID=UPI000EF497AF|nr:hypothetical protein [Virgibacillus sp. Bac332]